MPDLDTILKASEPSGTTVETPSGLDASCIEWTKARTSMGYGHFAVGGQNFYAHRIEYERLHGPIPEGMRIDHLCRNPSCINPEHLETVTHRENLRRGNSTKLTIEQVREIRRSKQATKRLAVKYGISRTQISNILRGESWRDA